MSMLDYYKLILSSSFVCNSDQLLSCTLWEDYCLQFLEYLNELENDGPIIVLLTHARIKEAHGIVSCGICRFFSLLNGILCSYF